MPKAELTCVEKRDGDGAQQPNLAPHITSRSLAGLVVTAVREEAPDGFGRLGVAKVYVLEDRVAVGPGPWRIKNRGDELLLGQVDIGRSSRQTVALQALVDRGEQRLVLAQEGSEEGPDTGELAVVAGPWMKVLDGMEDLVVGAAAGAAGPRGDHGHRRQHEGLGKGGQETL